MLDTTATTESDAGRLFTATCEHCSKPFTPRSGSGGRPQRFCSTECRLAFHAEARNAIEPQRSQRAPTCSDQKQPPVNVPAAAAKLPAEAAEASDEFQWDSDGSVILKEQLPVAAYFNRADELVLRQQRWPDDDAVIFVAQGQIGDFLERLTDICGIPSAGRR